MRAFDQLVGLAQQLTDEPLLVASATPSGDGGYLGDVAHNLDAAQLDVIVAHLLSILIKGIDPATPCAGCADRRRRAAADALAVMSRGATGVTARAVAVPGRHVH